MSIYQPNIMQILDIIEETPDVKTFRLKFKEKRDFFYQPGQFGLYSVFGEGESTFCIASSPTRQGYIECTVKKIGRVTETLHNLEIGDQIGFRGPYGNSFPVEELKGKNLIFIGGGLGLAPLRSLFIYCLDNRAEFGEITLVYGARSVLDLVYKSEINEWKERRDITIVLTVDPGGECERWQGMVCFVPKAVEAVKPSSENAIAIIAGPPIMIKIGMSCLGNLGFSDEQIITTLEMKMKCGLGKCGRCNIGSCYVCKDGPVFTYQQIKMLPPEF